jgi:hypothetical protein
VQTAWSVSLKCGVSYVGKVKLTVIPERKMNPIKGKSAFDGLNQFADPEKKQMKKLHGHKRFWKNMQKIDSQAGLKPESPQSSFASAN